jgi:precorrin-6A/cobalt-precorrin-6A reductase
MILILGGTEDSITLAVKLFSITKQIILSTATEYGMQVACKSFEGTITYGQMDYEELKSFCEKNNIKHIIDATHPYAVLVSENAIQVSSDLTIDYYRYERPESKELYSDQLDDCLIICKDYQAAGKLLEASRGNVLVTTGSRHIEMIIKEITDIKRVYVRILPKSEHLIKIEALGMMPEQIIAMKGPFSREMNKLMLKQINAKYIVTKESGKVGMSDEKILAAKEMGVKVIVIQRPKVNYPSSCSNIDEIVNLIKNKLLTNA